MMNRISVITICFNNLEDLKTTIEHLDGQILLPFEHIIIDGSSSDDIKNYLTATRHPAWRKWMSERDKGISDAWNKGIRMATGDIIHLHNSGDYYFNDNILQKVSDAFQAHPSIQWLHGQYAQYKAGTWVSSGQPFDPALLYRGFRTTGHPTMFVRKGLYDKYGLFDPAFQICADYDFLVRISREPFLFLNEPLVVFTPGGKSNTLIKKSTGEMVRIYTRYNGFSLRNRFWLKIRVPLLHYFTETALGKRIFQWKNRGKRI